MAQIPAIIDVLTGLGIWIAGHLFPSIIYEQLVYLLIAGQLADVNAILIWLPLHIKLFSAAYYCFPFVHRFKLEWKFSRTTELRG